MGDAIITSSLLRVIEVWTPDADGALTVESAIYSGVDQFEQSSEGLRLTDGAGLPGWVWSAGVPVLFEDLCSRDFVRNEAAAASNLGAGFGLPVFDGDELAAVMIFLFDADELVKGAFESWLPNEIRNELELGTGYYSSLERFRRLSQYLRFPYGAGLPGEVWQTLSPRLIDRLGESSQFLRASGAEGDGLRSGLAVPIVSGDDTLRSVFVLLSANEPPIARALQTWTPVGEFLELSCVVASGLPELEQQTGQIRCQRGEGLAGRVRESRRPEAICSFSNEPREFAKIAEDAGLSWALAWPVITHGEVQSICVILD